MKVCKRLLQLLAISLAAGTAASAQETKPDIVFAFHGILGGSLYYQDSILAPGNGEQSWFVAKMAPTHKSLVGGDVRQSRFNMSLSGPKIFGGAVPKGFVEIDFSNNAGPGTYGDVSIIPRLRHAYAELNWGNTAIRFGQDHELLIGSSPWAPPAGPTSVGHIGYPLVYEAGAVGWREPSFAIYQKIPDVFGQGGNLEFAAMVLRYLYLLRSSWPRILELIYWPTMQLFVWGFLQLYISQNAGYFARAGGIFSRRGQRVPTVEGDCRRQVDARVVQSFDEGLQPRAPLDKWQLAQIIAIIAKKIIGAQVDRVFLH